MWFVRCHSWCKCLARANKRRWSECLRSSKPIPKNGVLDSVSANSWGNYWLFTNQLLSFSTLCPSCWSSAQTLSISFVIRLPLKSLLLSAGLARKSHLCSDSWSQSKRLGLLLSTPSASRTFVNIKFFSNVPEADGPPCTVRKTFHGDDDSFIRWQSDQCKDGAGLNHQKAH